MTSASRIDGLVVEEQVLKLILELNPHVRLQAFDVAAGKRAINDQAVLKSIYEAADDGRSDILADVSDANSPERQVEKLISAIRPPATRVNPAFRERLLRFLNRYAPFRLPQTANILRQYEGHEAGLFAALAEKYGPEPALADVDYFNDSMPPLPAGWVRIECVSRGDVFYKNIDTGKRQWRRPF